MGSKITQPPAPQFKNPAAPIIVTTKINAGATNIDIVATQATADGFLVCLCSTPQNDPAGDSIVQLFGFTDSGNPPTTKMAAIQQGWQTGYGSLLEDMYRMRVKKNDYYKTTIYAVMGNQREITRIYYFEPIDIL